MTLTHAVGGIRKDERYEDFTSILSLIEKSKSPEECLEGIKYDGAAITKRLIEDDVYKKPYEKYVLLRLELAVAELDQIREFKARTTEHVFPQTPEDDSAWAAQASPEERAKFVNKLGNLILLSQGKNSAASNKDFPEKKEKYLAKCVSDFPRSSEVLGYADWTKDVIEERTAKAAALVLGDPARS